MAQSGLIQVYTGSGKGKTTAALGLALRAAGQDKKVALLQFMKCGQFGEVKALKKIKNITVQQFGRPSFVDCRKITSEDKKLAQGGIKTAERLMRTKKFDLMILDEINVALKFKLISLNELIKLIKKKPKNLELVLTGRFAHSQIIKLAHLVSEIKKIKHYFDRGVRARRGIEY